MRSDIFYSPEKTILQSRGGLYLVLDPLAPNWVSTNVAGAFIVRRLDGRNTLDEVAQELSRLWRVSFDKAREDTRDFVRKALTCRILSRVPSLEPPYRRAMPKDRHRGLCDAWVFITDACDLSGPLCSGRPPESASFMDASRVVGAADILAGLGARRLYLAGGEPLLHPSYEEAVSRALEKLPVVLVTYGHRMTASMATSLKGVDSRGFLGVQIHLEGPSAAIHDVLCGPSFDAALRSIDVLRDAGIGTSVATTLTARNADALAKTCRLAAQHGVPEMEVRWHYGPEDGELVPRPQSVATAMAAAMQACAESGVRLRSFAELQNRVQVGRFIKTDLCAAGVFTLAVACDGRVYPCPSFLQADLLCCGDMNDADLETIWRESPVLGRLREESVQDRLTCSACPMKFICGGGCSCRFALAQRERAEADDDGATDPFCKTYRELIDRLLWQEAAAGVDVDLADEQVYRRPVVYNAMKGLTGDRASLEANCRGTPLSAPDAIDLSP